MPRSLRAEIDSHRASIAFYKKAMEALRPTPGIPETAPRREELRIIVADLQRTLTDLEKVLAKSN